MTFDGLHCKCRHMLIATADPGIGVRGRWPNFPSADYFPNLGKIDVSTLH